MSRTRIIDEIVTQFFLNTSCRLRPPLSKHALQAIIACADKGSGHIVDDAEANFIPLTTGSVAEFYIELMLPHVGDIDVMHHLSTELAIPRGHLPPTQLQDEFSNTMSRYMRLLTVTYLATCT